MSTITDAPIDYSRLTESWPQSHWMLATSQAMVVRPAEAYIKAHMRLYQRKVAVKYLKEVLPGHEPKSPLPQAILDLIVFLADVQHELACKPQRICIPGLALYHLNAISLGETGQGRELILSQVVSKKSTKVTRVIERGVNGLSATTLSGPKEREELVAIARDQKGIFHYVRQNGLQRTGHLYEERGGALIPFDTVPDRYRVCSPEVLQSHNPYSGEMWRVTRDYGLMTYSVPNEGGRQALTQAEARGTLQRKCNPFPPPDTTSFLMTTHLSSSRMVSVCNDRIELFATEGERLKLLSRKNVLPALGDFTAAAHTPDRSRFFVAAEEHILTSFSVEEERILYQSVDPLREEAISSMAANSTALAMVTSRRYLFWDIERREPISTLLDSSLNDPCTALWLTEGNILFVRGQNDLNPYACHLIVYDFRTPPSQRSPVLDWELS